MAERDARHFDGASRGEIDALSSIYRRASRRLREIVLEPGGPSEASEQFRRARAASQVSQVDDLLDQLGEATGRWIGRNVPRAYRRGLLDAESQLRDWGLALDYLGGTFDAVDRRTIEAFARSIASDLAGATESMGDRSRDVIRRTAQIGLSQADIARILAGGSVEGVPRAAIRELREAMRAVHGDRVAVPTRSGGVMDFETGYYADLVGRTQTRQATVSARHERILDLGMDLVSIVGLDSDNFCTAFLGEVFSLSGDHPDYPAYSDLPGGGPPFHPNCSKSSRPFVEELATPEQLAAARGNEDSQRLLGMSATEAQRSFRDLQIRQQVGPGFVASTRG